MIDLRAARSEPERFRQAVARKGAGAAFEVVVEVGRYVARRAPGGLSSPHVLGGFLAGVAIMYVTGLLVA